MAKIKNPRVALAAIRARHKHIRNADWRGDIASFAHHVSDGRWKPYNWLQYTSDLIQKAIEKGGARIIINAPPRHGKSELTSKYTPAWILDRDPTKRIILTSYEADFAAEWGMKVRDLLTKRGDILPKVRREVSARKHWETLHGGSMIAVGVGGAISGRGADVCFPTGTMVSTEIGDVPIEQLHTMESKPRVLTYDHSCGRVLLKRIEATRRIFSDDFIEIETVGGNTIRPTREHRVYDRKRGYREAGSFLQGDGVFSLEEITKEQDVCDMRKAQNDKGGVSQCLLSKGTEVESNFEVQSLRERVRETILRIRKEFKARTQGFLLFAGMQQKTSFVQEHGIMPDLRKVKAKRQEAVLRRMQERSTQDFRKEEERTTTENLRVLQNGIQAREQSSKVLLHEMQEQGALRKNGWLRKFSLQGWRELCSMFQVDEKVHSAKGSEQVLRLWKRKLQEIRQGWSGKNGHDGPSHRRRSKKQSTGELDKSLLEVSFDSSQVVNDTVSRVEGVRCDSEPVYDIQVEGTHNFFANKVLVHNCIVDDPIKNWQDAYSKTKQLMLQNWFESTLMTRLEPNANAIVVMTRWAVDDLTGYLSKKKTKTGEKEWTVITLPALAEENDPLGRLPGEALCPERFSSDDLIKIRDQIGTHKFNCMYQQRPTAIKGGFIHSNWWGLYDELPSAFDDSLLSWDMTFKKTDHGSFVAGGAIGRIDAQYFVLPRLIHRRMNYPDTEKSVIELKRKYPWTKATLIEDKANGPAVLDSLKGVVDDLMPWQPLGKIAQASGVSAIIEAGNFLLPNPAIFPEAAKWFDDWIEEWTDFPEFATDDLVDMGSQGVLKLRERANVNEIFIGRA